MGDGGAATVGDHTPARQRRYARAPRVLWRRAPDRVLVRRVGGAPLELTGVAAFVWTSLDEPCTGRELERDLRDAVTGSLPLEPDATLHTALDRLLDHGLICEVP